MKRLWRISLVLLCLLAACSFPPYREELSLGFAAGQRLTELGAKLVKVGPLQGDNVWRDRYESRDYFYVPNKGTTEAELKSGFIVLVGPYRLQAMYVKYVDPDYFVSGGDLQPLNSQEETRCNYRTQTLKTAANPTLGATFFVQDDPLSNRFIGFVYNGSSYVDPSLETPLSSQLATDLLLTPPPEPLAIGSWIVPTDDTLSYDLQYFLVRLDGTNTFAEVEYQVDDGDFSTAPAGTVVASRENLSFNLPADLYNAFYYHHYEQQPALIHRNSYLCYYSALERKYKTYSWDDGGLLKPLVKLDRRIDALLSTGELLSFEDNRCTVFGSTGEKKYSFLTGGLRFVYEYFIDGEYHLFFTLPAWFDGWDHDGDERLYFYVYALPTRLMKDLS